MSVEGSVGAEPNRTSARYVNRAGARGLNLLREMTRRPEGLIGVILIATFLAVAILAPMLSPYTPSAQDVPRRLSGPSADYWLGTDHLGRDILSRIIHGGRVSMAVAVPSVAAALVMGLALGVPSGYFGGRLDLLIVTVSDTLQAFPTLVLALTLLVVLPPSQTSLILVIAFAFTPSYLRITRALVLNMKNRAFVSAARSLGATARYTIWRHILPNVLPPLLVINAMNLSQAIIVEAGLSFLGLGVRPPTPSWGLMLFDGFQHIRVSPWAVIWSGLALMVSTFGFTMVGETARDLVDPSLVSDQRMRQL